MLSVSEYVISIIESPSLFVSIVLAMGMLFVLVNKLAFGKFINGLFGLEFSTLFVSSVIVHLYFIKAIVLTRLIHYFFIEGIVFTFIILFYKNILKRKNEFKECLDFFFNKHSLIPIIVFCILIFVNLLSVPWNGESRIEFQTNYWFSFLRPLLTLFYPLLALGFYVHLHNNRNKMALGYLFLLIIYSVSSGSKASFLIALTAWFFVYRDIYNANSYERFKRNFYFIVLAILGAGINLAMLDIDMFGLYERLISFGDAAIMLYQANDPTLTCSSQSYFSLMYRGLARLFGDTSAMNIDTLFGYALSIDFYGENTFTGPNARLGPYVLCAFPGWSVILFMIMFLFYILILNGLLTAKKLFLKTEIRLALTIPFVISSINGYMIDYNQGVSDITFSIIFYGFMMLYSILLMGTKPIKNIRGQFE